MNKFLAKNNLKELYTVYGLNNCIAVLNSDIKLEIKYIYLDKSSKSKYSKPLLRKISSKYFNHDFFNRSKEGFDASVYTWPNQMLSYLLDYISDYGSGLENIGIDIRPLKNANDKFSRGYNKNLIFSLFILTKWLVNKNFIK